MCLDPIKFDSLSKEQDLVFNLPMVGSYLVVGPPGTGKSVVALHRAGRFAKNSAELVFLTKSRLLKEWTKESTKNLNIDPDSVLTYHSWAARWHLQTFRSRIPQHKQYVYDWGKVRRNIENSSFTKTLNIVIDEGQDLPSDFYDVLNLIAKTVTVFADENQTLGEENSSLEQIQKGLGVSSSEVLKLTKNYRNCREIAELSAQFYTGKSTGIPDLPTKQCGSGRPTINSFRNRNQQARFIHDWRVNNPTKKIGIFVPTAASRDAFQNLLEELGSSVQVFHGRTDVDTLELCEPGIFLTWFDNSKGLEFDHVFIPALEDWNPRIGQIEDERIAALRKLYVLTSRAKEQLHLMWAPDENGVEPVVSRLIPEGFTDLSSAS